MVKWGYDLVTKRNYQYSGSLGSFKMLLKQVLAKDFFSLSEMENFYRVEKSISFHPQASDTTYLLEDGFVFLVDH